MAVLLPDTDIISGDEPVPIPSVDYARANLKEQLNLSLYWWDWVSQEPWQQAL